MCRMYCDIITFNVGFKVLLLVQYYPVNSYLFISKYVQHNLLGIYEKSALRTTSNLGTELCAICDI
jgi:hypothetical protein